MRCCKFHFDILVTNIYLVLCWQDSTPYLLKCKWWKMGFIVYVLLFLVTEFKKSLFLCSRCIAVEVPHEAVLSHSCSVTISHCTIVTSACNAGAVTKQKLIGYTTSVAKMSEESRKEGRIAGEKCTFFLTFKIPKHYSQDFAYIFWQ